MFSSAYTIETFILSVFMGLLMTGLMYYAFLKRGNGAGFGWIYSAIISLVIFTLSYAKVKFGMEENFFQFIVILLHCNLGLAILFSSLYMVERHTRHEYSLIFFIFNFIVSTWGFLAVSEVGSLFWRLFPAAAILGGLEIISALIMLISFDYKFKPPAARSGVVLMSLGLIIDASASFGLLFTLGGTQGPFLGLGLAGRLALSSGLLFALYGE